MSDGRRNWSLIEYDRDAKGLSTSSTLVLSPDHYNLGLMNLIRKVAMNDLRVPRIRGLRIQNSVNYLTNYMEISDDILEVIKNLRKVELRSDTKPCVLEYKKQHEVGDVVTVKDLLGDAVSSGGDIELFHVTSEWQLNLSLDISDHIDPSEENIYRFNEVDYIIINRNFSPIKRFGLREYPDDRVACPIVTYERCDHRALVDKCRSLIAEMVSSTGLKVDLLEVSLDTDVNDLVLSNESQIQLLNQQCYTLRHLVDQYNNLSAYLSLDSLKKVDLLIEYLKDVQQVVT